MNTFYFTKHVTARLFVVMAMFSLVAGMMPTQAFAEENFTNTQNTNVNNDEPTHRGYATVVATKIVCTNEADLPNYGAIGEDAPNISATTAADWVATHKSCSLTPGWSFEWAPFSAEDPGDTLIGSAGYPWVTFGPTDANGQATSLIDESNFELTDNLWFREVLQSGYLPFTNESDRTNSNDVSAEMYCHQDVINYDNREQIPGIAAHHTYYCVAWNILEKDVVVDVCPNLEDVQAEVPKGYHLDTEKQCVPDVVTPPTCTVTIVSDTSATVVEKDGAAAKLLSFVHPAWVNIPGASWIWGDDPVADPSVQETQTFENKFGFVGTVTNATLYVATDNSHVAGLNGNTSHTAGDTSYAATSTYDVTSEVAQGNNVLDVAVTNKPLDTTDPRSNPAGAIYKLIITGTPAGDNEGCAVPYNDNTNGGGENNPLSCEITADPATVTPGGSTKLTWTSTGAVSAFLGDQSVDLNGSTTVSNLTTDGSYTLTVYDKSEGTKTCTVNVGVTTGGGGSVRHSSSGGSSSDNDSTPSGEVLGASTEAPKGEVLGAQVAAVPAGAPDTGAGGTSPFAASYVQVIPAAFLRRTRVHG